MKLTLAEAARKLGKSERQIRYAIKNGEIAGHKLGGRWLVESADLPLSEGQRSAVERKERLLRGAVEDGLGLSDQAASPRKRYSVRDLKAFQIGLPLWLKTQEILTDSHPAARALHRALELISLGCHRFEPKEKAVAYRDARDAASSAVCELVLARRDGLEPIIVVLEQDLMAAIAGLIRRIDGRRK